MKNFLITFFLLGLLAYSKAQTTITTPAPTTPAPTTAAPTTPAPTPAPTTPAPTPGPTTAVPTTTTTKPEPKCNEGGIWVECESTITTDAAEYEDCRLACSESETCTHFTFFPGTRHARKSGCLQFVRCNNFRNETFCPGCISGEKVCVPPKCGEDKCCNGAFVSSVFGITVEACLAKCKENPDCKWYTHNTAFQSCFLMKDCDKVLSEPSGTCSSGERACPGVATPTCNATYCCETKILEQYAVGDAYRCLKNCKSNPQCNWYSLHERGDDSYCNLHETCEEHGPDGKCKTGEKRCELEETTTSAPTTAPPPTTPSPETTTVQIQTTTADSTDAPTTAAPTTAEPTVVPTTAEPTAAPTTAAPTAAPTTAAPTAAPTTAAPTECWIDGSSVLGTRYSRNKKPDRETCFQECLGEAEGQCLWVTYNTATTNCDFFSAFNSLNFTCTSCSSRDAANIDCVR